MRKEIVWTGQEYHSMECCSVKFEAFGTQVRSTLIGVYQDEIYKADYSIQTDTGWATRKVEIGIQSGGIYRSYHFERTAHGDWISPDKTEPVFAGCIDIDISVTPFTNTLPIRRLALQPGQTAVIRVLYFDLLAGAVRPVRQRYTCLSAGSYRYENIPNDFEAVVQVDADGLVVEYPGLFTRTASETYDDGDLT